MNCGRKRFAPSIPVQTQGLASLHISLSPDFSNFFQKTIERFNAFNTFD